MIPSAVAGGGTVIQLGELVMILDLHRQGLSVSAIILRLTRDALDAVEAKFTHRATRPAGASTSGIVSACPA